jgi:Fe-S cluster biogenesis protein NfuA
MAEKINRTGRPQVRAENPSGACGYVDHMTIDELKARAVGENFDGSCPACGMFHLTRADIDKIVSEKISETKYYVEMKREAEQA